MTSRYAGRIGRSGWSRTVATATGVAVMLAIAVAPAPFGAVAVASSPSGAIAVAPAPSGQSPVGQFELTLLTGDRAEVTYHPDGTHQIDLDLADRGGVEVTVETIDAGADVYVVPSDVAPYLNGRLDRELFNVTALVRSGYHRDGTGTLPVIVTYRDGAEAAPSVPLAGATTLSAIDSAAVALDQPAAEAFWQDAVVTPGAAGADPDAALAGIERIWLDRRVEAVLQDSVPLVNAPQAWDAGYDGTGVRVAVLDTGIDTEHPDLAGKVVGASNWTGDIGFYDDHGHGTHVAATVAGTGAGSLGLRRGVAPGADLLNGKVLDHTGSGQTSWIISGMQWATQTAHADVVSMSLGNVPTDGTDPLSQAVDSLTAQTGALFVIAAGNLGQDGVSAPGAASTALTVGAVDKSEQLAYFSGRGPRRGDYAIKPDITAPGVDIVAARAAGTTLGDPVDPNYTRLSGTSMATPHVAGAAAILAQQRPGWDPAQLKAALVSTAVPRPGPTIYQQGGGRLDVGRAVTATLLPHPGPIDLGYFPYPHEGRDPSTHQVGYTNLTGQEVTVRLSLELQDQDGARPAAGMVTFEPAELTIAPHGTAAATITVDTTVGEPGLYGGHLEAGPSTGAQVHTPAGFYKEDERYGLTIRGIDTDGNPAAGDVTVMNVQDQDEFLERRVSFDATGVAQVRVPPGPYAVFGFAYTQPPGEPSPTVVTAVAAEVEVGADLETVLDARTSVPISVTGPAGEDVAPRLRNQLILFREAAAGGGLTRLLEAIPEDWTFRAIPTDPVDLGYFEFYTWWQLTDPVDPVGSPVQYQVVFPEAGRIPTALDYQVDPDQLATEQQEFHRHVTDVPDHQVQEVRHPWRPWQTSSVSTYLDVVAPGVRTDHLTAAGTVVWSRNLWFRGSPGGLYAGQMNAPRTGYQPGVETTSSWLKQPVQPGLIEGSPWHPSFPQVRDGDVLELFVAEFRDSQPGHWGWADSTLDRTQFRLYRDGNLVKEAARPRGDFLLSPEPSRVRMETEVWRDADWWTMSTHTSTAWEFDSERPAAGPELVPMLLLDYDLDLDLLNSAAPSTASNPQTVGLGVRHQPGRAGPAIAGAVLSVSYDDGASWEPTTATDLGGGQFSFELPTSPAGAQFGSLRVQAWDADDNRIEQEITRAWTIRGATR